MGSGLVQGDAAIEKPLKALKDCGDVAARLLIAMYAWQDLDRWYGVPPHDYGRLPPTGRRAARAEWLANITNDKTRHAYKIDVGEFPQFLGLRKPEEFRTITRAHVIAWRETLEARELSAPTIRRKLSALSSLYEYLCERNAVGGESRRWREKFTRTMCK